MLHLKSNKNRSKEEEEKRQAISINPSDNTITRVYYH